MAIRDYYRKLAIGIALVVLVGLVAAPFARANAEFATVPAHQTDTTPVPPAKAAISASSAGISEVGQIGSPMTAVAVEGQTAYVGAGRRLLDIDVSDPTHPMVAGAGGFLAAAVQAVAVTGHDAYVADGSGGLHVFDVAKPSDPVQVASLAGEATGVKVFGSLAYVFSSFPGPSEVRVVSVADPAHPVVLSSISVQGNPVTVAVKGNFAYLGVRRVDGAKFSSGGGLYVIDLTDPSHPSQSKFASESVTAVVRLGDYLYESSSDTAGKVRFRVFDVSRPSEPRVFTEDAGGLVGCRQIVCAPAMIQAASNDLLFAVAGNGLSVIDAHNPTHVVYLGSYQIPGQFRGISAIAASGSHVYATDAAGSGLHIIDVSQPSKPKEVGAYLAPGHASHVNGVAVVGHNAYIADGYYMTLHIVDVSDPSRPVEIGSHQLASGVQDVAVSGGYAYVATVNTGLQIVDVSDPRNSVAVGSFGLGRDRAGAPIEDWTVAVAGKVAYVPDATRGLRIIDVADPRHPVEVGRYPGPIDPYVLALSGTHAYVVEGQQLLTLDVANPSRPMLLARMPLRANPRDIVADRSRVYVTYWTGLDVIDVSDSRHPKVIGSLNGLSSVNSVAVSGGELLLTDGTKGVHVIDATDPRHLRAVGLYPLDGDTAGVVTVHEGLAYVGTLFGGLFILRPDPPHDARYFPQTGFRIDNEAIWDYFSRRGGINTFGYPISRTFEFEGFPTQFFQRRIVRVGPTGQARLLNLLDPGLLPYDRFNGAQMPSFANALVATAPSPTDGPAMLAWVQAHAPDSFQGLPVNFYQTFINSVSISTAFLNGGDPSLLPGFDLELWGIPTSAPMADPNNHNVVYLRWQRGIMQYDATCQCTHAMLLGDYFKSILTGQNLPSDLAQEAKDSPFYRQYDPSATNRVRDPSKLSNTDLTNAFTPG